MLAKFTFFVVPFLDSIPFKALPACLFHPRNGMYCNTKIRKCALRKKTGGECKTSFECDSGMVCTQPERLDGKLPKGLK